MKLQFAEISLETTLPRTHDTVLGAVVNSFAARLPWGGAMLRIIEQKRDSLSFSVESLASFSLFTDSGEMHFSEDGRKTHVSLYLNMCGSLFALYALHWLIVTLALMVQFIFIPLLAVSNEAGGLIFAAFIAFFWPVILFEVIKTQQKRKLEVFLANLIYYV